MKNLEASMGQNELIPKLAEFASWLTSDPVGSPSELHSVCFLHQPKDFETLLDEFLIFQLIGPFNAKTQMKNKIFPVIFYSVAIQKAQLVNKRRYVQATKIVKTD